MESSHHLPGHIPQLLLLQHPGDCPATVEELLQRGPSAGMRVVLGMPAGIVGSVVACPLDVVKTRSQVQEIGE